ncbi:LEAF RUST 10 DISEASE-RESISTANCE LOCUS RECEPTOR-LIKE PROTEIN KINASE-like 2.1 [Cardamine amara subsp. amara]|uniref:non-specific serine/threonine protein kinase n=1 Tax=Cardamine amara subsp. amara TaxID=228776 RepID=A0ABD0ZZS1_CARAN
MYPFWTPYQEGCGHPDFKVNCSGDFAEFNISSVTFQILQMNYTDVVIRLSRMDYRNNLCPQYHENTTILQEILPFRKDTVLGTFYYNCSGPRVDLFHNGYITQLDCKDDIGGPSYFVSSPSDSGITTIDGLRASCERIVNLPVSRSALKTEDRNQSLETIKKALDEGFKLSFNGDCSSCILQVGNCGFNESSNAFACYCEGTFHEQTCPYETEQKSPSKKPKTKTEVSIAAEAGIAFASAFLGVILIAGFLFCFIIRNRGTSHYPRQHNLKALVQLKQYTYAEVKKITKSFSQTVGKGGFGTVYSGNLYDGRKVAVKILKDFKSSGEDFINEVASMSQTSHINIVSLLGFCYEGSKRAIVYEFLENGSLDQFISEKKSLNLDVGTLYRIALGVSRGLEYMHHGCKTRIVHFDIKPQNVLLDENFCPKVSDFGLAKLCEKRESILSLLNARGTIGYIAPEVTSGMYGRISHKSDVYSYGMLVLEMIGARNQKPVETAASKSSSAYFPDWIYKDLENGEHAWKFGDEITREEKDIAKKMILVGLWCIQPCPLNRPPMNRVVEMMEGSLDALEVPPKPSLYLPAMPLPESSCLSEENSNYSEAVLL